MVNNVFFKHVILTNKSREFITKIITENKQMRFTKAEVGDGQVTSDNLQDLTSLINFKQEAEIVSVRRNEAEAVVDIRFNSGNVVDGFALREIGLYAQMDDEEVLYAYLNAGDKYDFVAPTINGQAFSQNIQLVISVGDASNVEVVFNDLNITDGSITINMLDDSVKDKINSIDTHGSQTIIDADGVHGLKYDEASSELKYKKEAAWHTIQTGKQAETTINTHKETNITDADGIHGLKYDKNASTLQYKDRDQGNTWVTIPMGNQSSPEINTHKQGLITGTNGIHGIKYDTQTFTLQYNNQGAWEEIQTGKQAETTINAHKDKKITGADGVHGLKYDTTQRKFQYFTDASQWEDVTLSNITNNNVDQHINKKICDDGGVHGIAFEDATETIKIEKRDGRQITFNPTVNPDQFFNEFTQSLDEMLRKVGTTNG